MPKNTGIKNREQFINKVLVEDQSVIGENTPYGRYLNSLKELVRQTNEIFEKDGYMDKDSYENLVNQYMAVIKDSIAFRDSGESQERRDVVEHIYKIAAKDLKALNSMDKEKPGNIRTAFETSRYVTLKVPQDMTHKVGGQASDRFPVIDTDGKKGFFTARTDSAHDKEWNELIDTIFKNYKLTRKEKAVFNKLRTDHELRGKIVEPVANHLENGENKLDEVAVALTFFENNETASENLQRKNHLAEAVRYFAGNSIKLLTPYNLKNRMGYDPYTRTDNKNEAMYEVAKLLGCEKLVAKTVPMKVVNGDKVIKGTFMENAEGSDLATMSYDDPITKVNKSSSMHNKSLYENLADLQLLDYICGNVDRHKQNMIYKTEQTENGTVNITGVTAIDNDASFPEKDIEDYEFIFTENTQPRIFKPENFRYVNRKTAEIVLNLKREQLEMVLRGQNITQAAIAQAWIRTQRVQAVLREREKNNIFYVEDIKVGEAVVHEDPLSNPFRDKYEDIQNPSIFTGFNTQVCQLVDMQKTAYVDYMEENHGGFNEAELLNILKAEKEEDDAKIARAEQLDKDALLFANFDTIETMNSLTKRVNSLKIASSEFAKMRNAMYSLHKYSQQLASQKKKDNKPLTRQQYAEYEKRMLAMREATREYIQKKGITQKTKNGRERHDAALRLFNRADMLFANFEAIKEQEEKLKYRPAKGIKAEAKMYSDIKPVFKDSSGKKYNVTKRQDDALKRTIDHLLERKQILDKLSGEPLSAEDESAWLGRLEENDNYFAGMNDDTRKFIMEAFASERQEIVTTKEWQSLQLAFMATENIASYKAVESMNATLEGYKKLKADIDVAKADVIRQMDEAKKGVSDLTVQNAEEKYNEKAGEIKDLKEKIAFAGGQKAEADKALQGKDELVAKHNKFVSDFTEKYKKKIEEPAAKKEKLVQLKQQLKEISGKTDDAEKVALYGQIFSDAEEKDGIKADQSNIDEKLKARSDDVEKEIEGLIIVLNSHKKKFESDLKKQTDTFNTSIKRIEDAPKMHEIRIGRFKKQLENAEKARDTIDKFRNPAEHFDISRLKAAVDKGRNTQKIDLNAVVKTTTGAAVNLMKMAQQYSNGNGNSQAFETMVQDLAVVVGWGEERNVLNGMQNPPKTVEQALANLKNSSKKCAEEKDKKGNPNPYSYMQKQLAKTIDAFAEQSLECMDAVATREKAVISWDKYFQSGGRIRVPEENKNNLSRNENQLEEPEKDENDVGFDI